MPEVSPSRYLVTANWNDVPHLTQKMKDELLESTPKHMRDARSKGIPTMGSGLIFPVDESAIECAPFAIPSHWAQINGLDFGWDHPMAAANLAWDRDADCVYVTKEYRKSETLNALNAVAVKAWGDWIPCAWPHDGLQHDKGSGEETAEQYRKHGLNMLPEKATWPDGGNGVEAGIQDMLERMETGRWKVFSTCTMWLEERGMYHRKDGKIVKLMDDCISPAVTG